MTRQKDCFTGRDRSRLRRARENGYLDACGRSATALRDAYSFWCWRLRLPVVWFERLSARSKYGRLCVDLFTTPNEFDKKGEGELKRLGSPWPLTRASPHDAVWDRVPAQHMEKLAKAALRIALRAEKVRAATARTQKVLAWKMPA